MKKRILIYGDSNTWGSDASDMRYPSEVQWSSILQDKLESDYEVVQEGLCGRISGDHDKSDAHRNGRIGYEIALRSASPFDYLVVGLGANDLKKRYGLTPEQIAEDLLWYKTRTEQYSELEVDMSSQFKKVFYIGIANFHKNLEISYEDAVQVNKIVKESGESFIELSDLQHSSDGLHYSKLDHETVAEKVYYKIKEFEDEV